MGAETQSPCANCGHSAGHHRNYRKSCGYGRWCECQKFVTPAPSPVRDDAEKVIAGLLAEHTLLFLDEWADRCKCGWLGPDADNAVFIPAHRAHVASVIAAQLTAPDELTALREEADRQRKRADAEAQLRQMGKLTRSEDRLNKLRDERDEARAERDALRERIRKLAGEWDATVLVLGGTNRKPVPRWFSQRLRAALGDS